MTCLGALDICPDRPSDQACESLVERGWRIEVVDGGDVRELAGYRLSPPAAASHELAKLGKQAGRSRN